ncbi:MAG: hypothetical protein AUJ75_02635 [Candidatus Omnitrophica bacterium CG1_02_49_10]|nr:MAG: hypothetical protein AUJ75_02635 [Candidatus Omnitrophica bacterium CG1_02_49_10]
MRKRVFLACFLFLFLVSAYGCGKKDASTLALVNGKAVTIEDYNDMLTSIAPQFKGEADAHKRDLLNNMVLDELIYQDAVRAGGYKDIDNQKLIESSKKRILIAWLLNREVRDKINISEEAVRAYYDGHKAEFIQPETVRAGYILVDSESEAADIKQQIEKGGNFEELAKKYSKDPSALSGGDLGYLGREQLGDEIFDMKPGSLSDIAKTPLGYYMVKIGDKKPARQFEFEESRERAGFLYAQEERAKIFDGFSKSLQSSARVKYVEKALKENAIENADSVNAQR